MMYGATTKTAPGQLSPFAKAGDNLAVASSQRPLWLTAGEADLLLALSSTSPLSGGTEEHELFRKLGEYLRAFPAAGSALAASEPLPPASPASPLLSTLFCWGRGIIRPRGLRNEGYPASKKTRQNGQPIRHSVMDCSSRR